MSAIVPNPLPLVAADVAFFRASPNAVLEVFDAWCTRNLKRTGQELAVGSRPPGVVAALEWLFPLTREDQRSLFITCQNGWTLYVDNSFPFGGGRDVVDYLGEHVDCQAIRACVAEGNFPKRPNDVSVFFQLHERDRIGDYVLRRCVEYARDDGPRELDLYGDPLPFEDPDLPKTGKFTTKDLLRYLGEFDIHSTRPDFYLDEPILTAERSPPSREHDEYSIEDARELLGVAAWQGGS